MNNQGRDASSFDRKVFDEAFDLRQYWRTLILHKWGIIGFTLIVTALTVMVVSTLRPQYQATATLMIDTQEANVVSIQEVYGLDRSNRFLFTQFKIIESRKLAEKVIKKLNLTEHPEFNPEPEFSLDWREWLPVKLPEAKKEEITAEQKLRGLINNFSKRLSVTPVGGTQLVKISFMANDPVLAAQVANAIGEAYIQNNLDAKLDVTMQASSWLSERLGGLQAEVKAAEAKLQAFREKEKIVGEGGGSVIAGKELDLVSEKLVEARRDRLALQSVYSQIQAVGDGPANSYELIPGVLQNPTVQQFKSALLSVELKRSDMAKRYGAKHPKMQAVQSELANARKSLDSQIMSVINGIRADYRAALASERSLEQAVSKTKVGLQELGRKEYQLRELEQSVEAKRSIYDTFLQRFNETSATGDLKSSSAQLVDPAVVPSVPVKPNKRLIIALALVGGLAAGMLFAFLLESLNNTLRIPDEVETKLNSVMLGVLPLLKSSSKAPDPAYHLYLSDNLSVFAESVRTIRTGIVLSALDNPHKVIAVTSALPGEGKTSVSLNLAFALGQMEKTLLIGADMRRPAFAAALGLEKHAPGLSNLVAGTACLEDCLVRHEEGGIDVLPAGIIPPNPLDLLSSERFASTLAQLEGQYDRIVIDTAPTLLVSDAMVISPLVGGVVCVVKADATPYQQARAGIKRLHDVHAPLIGVVLNQLDTQKASKYYGAEYGGYYDAYGYVEKPQVA